MNIEFTKRDCEGFLIRWKPSPHAPEHAIAFEAFAIVSPGITLDEFYFNGLGEPSKGLDNSEPWLTGSIKWDGCSNWIFRDQEHGVAIHFCDRPRELSALFEKMYDIAKRELKTADFD